MRRTVASHLVRLVVAAGWIGIIVAISGIEAPLKFQAPGITVPLGLGIGRLVFTAVNIVAVVCLVAIVVATVVGLRRRVDVVLTAVLALTVVAQVAVIRPLLNARTDIVLAGGDPGESWLHYGYIALEAVTFALLMVLIVRSWRAVMASSAAPSNGNADDSWILRSGHSSEGDGDAVQREGRAE